MDQRDIDNFVKLHGYVAHPIDMALHKLGMSRPELQERLGVGASAMCAWCCGRRTPTLQHAKEICEALHYVITIEDIAYWDGEKVDMPRRAVRAGATRRMLKRTRLGAGSRG